MKIEELPLIAELGEESMRHTVCNREHAGMAKLKSHEILQTPRNSPTSAYTPDELPLGTGFWRNFVNGFSALGLFEPRPSNYKIADEALTYNDWLMVGQDLCGAIDSVYEENARATSSQDVHLSPNY